MSEALLVLAGSVAIIAVVALAFLWGAYRGALDVAAMLLIEFTESGEHEVTTADEQRYVASGYRGVDIETPPGGGMKVRLR